MSGQSHRHRRKPLTPGGLFDAGRPADRTVEHGVSVHTEKPYGIKRGDRHFNLAAAHKKLRAPAQGRPLFRPLVKRLRKPGSGSPLIGYHTRADQPTETGERDLGEGGQRFNSATDAEILNAEVADSYFHRTMEVLRSRGLEDTPVHSELA